MGTQKKKKKEKKKFQNKKMLNIDFLALLEKKTPRFSSAQLKMHAPQSFSRKKGEKNEEIFYDNFGLDLEGPLFRNSMIYESMKPSNGQIELLYQHVKKTKNWKKLENPLFLS